MFLLFYHVALSSYFFPEIPRDFRTYRMTESVPDRSIVKIFFHACQSRSVCHYWKLRLRARRRRAWRIVRFRSRDFPLSNLRSTFLLKSRRTKEARRVPNSERPVRTKDALCASRASELGATKSAAISQVANERGLREHQQQTPRLLPLAEFADEQSVVAGARCLQERREIRRDEHQPHHKGYV